MSPFEYLMVMTSVVLALALAQLLRGATEIFTNPNRYWVHSTWVLTLIFVIIQLWWGLWDINNLADWTFLSFLYVLSLPIGIFIAAYLLIPANRTADSDWHEHFFAVRRWFFLTLLGFSVLAMTLSWALLGASLLHPYRIFQSILIIMNIVGLISKQPRIHEVLAVIYLIVFLAGQLAHRMTLGALAGISS